MPAETLRSGQHKFPVSFDPHSLGVRPFQEIDSLKNMKKAVSNSRKTISLEGNVFLELPNTLSCGLFHLATFNRFQEPCWGITSILSRVLLIATFDLIGGME